MVSSTGVQYRDRRTGEIVIESVLYEPLLRWIYGHPAARKLIGLALNTAAFCWVYGKLQDLPGSRKKIPEFVARHRIDTEEAEFPVDHYRSFNAFFTRRLKPETRPFDRGPNVFCSPAEGKVQVVPRLEANTRIPVKSASIPIASLLASESDARPYEGGSALVIRLAPYDYHRFHFPDAGQAGPARVIPGEYHVVSPIALAAFPGMFCLNKRTVTPFLSERFGQIGYVEIGGFTVATIVQTYTPGQVTRGQEKGYFQFGGSTVILLFEPATIVFDDDLIRDSEAGLEVQAQVGSRIGRRHG